MAKVKKATKADMLRSLREGFHEWAANSMHCAYRTVDRTSIHINSVSGAACYSGLPRCDYLMIPLRHYYTNKRDKPYFDWLIKESVWSKCVVAQNIHIPTAKREPYVIIDCSHRAGLIGQLLSMLRYGTEEPNKIKIWLKLNKTDIKPYMKIILMHMAYPQDLRVLPSTKFSLVKHGNGHQAMHSMYLQNNYYKNMVRGNVVPTRTLNTENGIYGTVHCCFGTETVRPGENSEIMNRLLDHLNGDEEGGYKSPFEVNQKTKFYSFDCLVKASLIVQEELGYE